MATRFCPTCGAPVVDAADTFCGNCGNSLAQLAPLAAPPTPAFSPTGFSGASGAPAGGPARSRSGAPTGAASGAWPVATPLAEAAGESAEPFEPAEPASGTKAAWLALLLELLVPGAGAVYAGQAVRGIVWLLATVAGVLVEAGLLNTAHPLRSSVILVSLLTWLVVRCVLVSDQVDVRNARVRGAPMPPLYSAGGAIGATVGVIVIALLLGGLFFLTPHSAAITITYWGWASVAAYWVALCRLPRAGAAWVCAEVIAWNLLVFLVVDLALVGVVRSAAVARAFPLGRGQAAALLVDLELARMVIEVVIASLLGSGFALVFARWSGVRTMRGAAAGAGGHPRGTAGAVALALLVSGMVALGYATVLVALAPRAAAGRAAGMFPLWEVGVPIAAWVALPWFAAWRALRVLRERAPAGAAPPLAPTPTPPPYYPQPVFEPR